MRLLAIVVCAGLTGCQSLVGSNIPSPSDLQAALNARFAGVPIERVIERYGMPGYQFMHGDVRVLVWQAETTLRHHEPVTTTTTGRVGGTPALGWADAIPYRETTTMRQGYDATYSCKMQAGMKPDGTVDGIGAIGKMGACQVFMP